MEKDDLVRTWPVFPLSEPRLVTLAGDIDFVVLSPFKHQHGQFMGNKPGDVKQMYLAPLFFFFFTGQKTSKAWASVTLEVGHT